MNKLKILFISITSIIIIVVVLLTMKNYFPDSAISMKAFPDNKYLTNKKLYMHKDAIPNEITVMRITPKQFDSLEEKTKAENISEPRVFDDIIKATETFSPLVVPFITFYLYKKKKKIDKNLKTKDDE